MKEEFIVNDHTPDSPPITPDNCDLVICYDFKTKEVVVYTVNMPPKELTFLRYHDAMQDISKWILSGAIRDGIIQENNKRSRSDE
jgi:hypothetical protein